MESRRFSAAKKGGDGTRRGLSLTAAAVVVVALALSLSLSLSLSVCVCFSLGVVFSFSLRIRRRHAPVDAVPGRLLAGRLRFVFRYNFSRFLSSFLSDAFLISDVGLFQFSVQLSVAGFHLQVNPSPCSSSFIGR